MSVYKFEARSVSRPGYDGFCRGGIKWPSDAYKEVIGTERLMKLIRAETMVSMGDCNAYVPQDGDVVLDIPAPQYVDKAAQIADEAARLKAEMATMTTELELESIRLAHSSLAAKLAAKKLEQPAVEPAPAENKSKK